MAEPKDPPIPIRIPFDLLKSIDEVSTLTGLSKQDVMRLCMRIGLVDLKAAEHDLPGIVKQIADDKGVSFQAFAKNASQTGADLVKPPAWTPPPSRVQTAASTSRSHASAPDAQIANIVPLPPQHVVSLNESAQTAPIPARDETLSAFPKPARKSRDS